MKRYSGDYHEHVATVLVYDDELGRTVALPTINRFTSAWCRFDWGYGWKGPKAAIAPAPATLAHSLLHDAYGPELAAKYWLPVLKALVSKLEVEQPWEISKADLDRVIATIKGRSVAP